MNGTEATKKSRQMSVKGFLRKATSAKSALGFLDQYRSYMTTGELSSVLSPIVAKVDSGELMPTPAVSLISHAVMAHIIAIDTAKAEKAIEAQEAGPTSNKPWLCTIYNSSDVVQTRLNAQGEEEDLIKGFGDASSADRYADRNLIECSSDCYAVVESTTMKVRTVVLRADAMSRVLRAKKSAVVHVKGKSTKSLGFGMKVHESRARFSDG
jgi:hypothetical protein